MKMDNCSFSELRLAAKPHKGHSNSISLSNILYSSNILSVDIPR